VPSGASMTFAEAAQLYIEFRNPSIVDRQRIDKVAAPSALGKFKIQGIRPADIHKLAVRLHPSDAPATRNRNVLRPVTTVLHHAANAGLCDWVKVQAFKEPKPVTRALDPEAAAQLINAAKPGPQRQLLVWLFFQGTRISATLKLDWSQIDLAAKTVRIWNAKGDRWETFPLHEMTLDALGEQGTGPVFPWSNRSSLRRWLPALCERVGVEFTPHMGRHTLGTIMAANGETLRAIMAALGHSTPSSSIRYQGADIEMVRAATARVKLPLTTEYEFVSPGD
jgi:integrase